VLDVSALNAVTAYEPNELIVTVEAGAPLADVMSLIDSKNQQFAFEPVDTAPLLGTQAGGTIGGMIAAGLAGPRRIKAGAARDHLLGAHAVSGFGDSFKAGGKVVKNVTGYDMCKLLAGSWGTLAAMTDITVKVLPKAETEATVIVEGLDDARACAAMAAAMGSSCDVSGAAHLPDHVASYFDGLPKPEAATALRVEGFPPSVKHRKEALAALMKSFGPVVLLDEKESRALWRSVRQVKPFAGDAARARPLWRISTAPSKGNAIAAAITPPAQS
jgi:glycolate oxidase FAD binding subunit